MNDRKVPISLAEPAAVVYNAREWEKLRAGVANQEFTAVEIKAFYVIGLLLEICASVDCLLKTSYQSERGHPFACRVFTAGGRYLPAFGVFAAGVELLGRCLTGNETAQVNENLHVGFFYLADPKPTPLLGRIPENAVVLTAGRDYTVQDLIDLRNYAAHGQTTSGQRDAARRVRPMPSPPGIEKEIFAILPSKMARAVDTFWTRLQYDQDHCSRLAKSRIDPYSNRKGPLEHVIAYFGQVPYKTAGSLFELFDW